jgi:hypothetical protein
MPVDPVPSRSLKEWQANAQGTTAGVTLTQAAPTAVGRKHVLEKFEAYGDAAAIVTVESPAATLLWKEQFAGAFNIERTLDIEGAKDQALLVKISASTAFCGVNAEGHEEQA